MEKNPSAAPGSAPRAHRGRRLRAAWAAALLWVACEPGAPDGDGPEPGPGAAPPPSPFSADARLETYEMLRADLDAPRHPSDGGGRAWIVANPEPQRVPAATPAKLTLVYEAGPLGVAEGGVVFLQPSPFWDWDPPQIRYAEAPGYTVVTTDAEGIELLPNDDYGAFLSVEIRGRALAPGERITFVYGEGQVGARVDRFAERRSPVHVVVDGDGDGVRQIIAADPAIDVLSHPPLRLHVVWDSTARPGGSVRLRVSTLDAMGNATAPASGGIAFVGAPPGLGLPAEIALGGEHGGHRSIAIDDVPPGVHRLQVRGTGELEGLTTISNPLVVRPDAARILWGDLHGHSQLSDGTGTPDDYYRYARDFAGLDVSALTDHDHWGMRQLSAEPALWQEIRDAVTRHHDPGQFVALLGYEWTSWLHGHRHVLYFDADGRGEILSSMDPRYETPKALWDALRGQQALTFAHHSAGGPVSTNWRYAPDPELEPVTEIVSVHGSSEAADSPFPIYDPVPGNYARDAVGAGYVLGFIGSGDSHDGHPGLVQIADPTGSGGLAAIESETLTRDGVLDALRARRVYATSGPRIWLRVSIDGRAMGSVVMVGSDETAATETPQTLRIDVVGTAPIERIDLIRSAQTATIPGEDRLEIELEREIPPLKRGEYHYVRVVQSDGGAAWSSPIFAR